MNSPAVTRVFCFLSLWMVAGLAFPLQAKPQAGAASSAVRAAARSAAQSDPLLDAMLTELERSQAGLKMDQVQAPYYIEYRLSEVEGYTAEAAFGGLREDQEFHVRFLRAVVRVGDYKQDSYYGEGTGAAEVMPLDNDPLALRHQIWLVTDQAYKSASEALTAKQDMLKQDNVDQPVDDFARATELQSIGPVAA